MRLDYAPKAPEGLGAEEEQIYDRIRARRAPGELLPLDLALLHTPKMADGWNSLLGAVRTKGCLSDDLREIAICRPAIINRAWFEWAHHAPLLTATPGFTEEQYAVVKQPEPKEQGPLTDKQWAVLRYSDAMTKTISVPDDIFEGLQKAGFTDREIVEITLTCAAYNMVSRFLVALNVGEANGEVPDALKAHFGEKP
ncbi:hypothetical protein AYO21_06490 [Fonsecaea monophora]|uniref:Carboxymuconolactone decarboxylase-like domain-containing protein n=1 Tax=Fonsecaea monophora TaxID=254056 RepID=A0A177F609_9EURO|nr:hypothetical protein AYO21_06490 [Fonsecaea monophora]KAH0830961.1 4-carboxymuconolactone decarboxylase [Fonsecaea pedrosoi]OAG39286.1 hypothetical protein AYO21_06490 [Fonsecaea monophora]